MAQYTNLGADVNYTEAVTQGVEEGVKDSVRFFIIGVSLGIVGIIFIPRLPRKIRKTVAKYT